MQTLLYSTCTHIQNMHTHWTLHVKCDTCGATMCRYPWHVLFTGIRILMVGDVIGDYFADDEDGQYIGYQ